MVSVAAARGQSALDGYDPNANGVVRVIVVQPDGKALIAGDFTTLSPNGGPAVRRNTIARMNPDGTLDTAFDPNPDGAVYAIALQADGKIVVGGGFLTIGGRARQRIARLDATTGQITSAADIMFNPTANNLVYTIAVQADGKILAGGDFRGPNSIGGQPRNFIARLYADGPMTGLADSFDPNANGLVFALLVEANGKILVAGNFNGTNSIGGADRNGFARLDEITGAADPMFDPDSNGLIRSIAVQADGKILAAGHFTNIGGQPRNYIARLDEITGAADSMFDPNARRLVYAIAVQADGKILAVGDFFGTNSIGAADRDFIARLDPVDGRADAFNPNAIFTVASVAVQADGFILAGGFGFNPVDGVGGQTRNGIARLHPDGRLDQTLNLSIAGDSPYVSATAVQPDGKILIGGYFTSVLGVARNNLARLNTDGTLDQEFKPNPNDEVFTIAMQADGRILVGGRFASIGGAPRNHVARLDATTGLADLFNPNTHGGPLVAVRTIVVQADEKILLGGDFETLEPTSGMPVTRKYIARLNPDGTLDDAFNANANSGVQSIAVDADGKILVGGYFTNIGDLPRNRIARLDATTGKILSPADVMFDPNVTCSLGCGTPVVHAIAVQPDRKILVGGRVTNIGGQTRKFIARLDADTGLADSFDPNLDFSFVEAVYTIAVRADRKILVGGDIAVQGRQYMARLNPNGTLDTAFNPNPDNIIVSIAVQEDGKILAGSAYRNIGGQPRSGFARLSNDTAALQQLTASQNVFAGNITWTRGGSSPQFTRVTFEYSTDNMSYMPLGNGTAVGSKWILAGPSLRFPTGRNFYIRARGHYTGGLYNGSESISESVRNGYITPLRLPRPSMTVELSTRFSLSPCCAERAPGGGPAVPTGTNVGIGGFIITGSAPKHVLVRAIGPSLTQFGVPNALADPVLELHGPGAFATITNDNWRDDPAQEGQILTTGLPPSNDRESAIDATLDPGAYTAVVSGQNGTPGVALVEIYDVDEEPVSRLANISTRAFVGTGDNILIAGVILGNGDGDDRIVVRGIGPSLAAFGVPNALADPTLELRDNNGALLIANNDWQENPEQAGELTAAGLAPTNQLESGMAATLPPGLYTALLAGLNNGTGVGLVEVYDLGAP